MNIVNYIKDKGLKRTILVIYQYKIDIVIQKILYLFLKNKKLKNIIIIESHNDFDAEGGAFYDYLIKKGYNEKYKIIWLLKLKVNKKFKLPYNVRYFYIFKPSIMKDYYINIAKIFTADNFITPKLRDEQKSFFFRHGAGGLKNTKGIGRIPSTVDYILGMCEDYSDIERDQLSMSENDKRLVYLGFPSHDVLLSDNRDELKKITDNKFRKVVLWMPTFRKGGGYNRNDSEREQPLGIPLINDIKEYENLNELLNNSNVLLIIKIHPMQNLEDLKIYDTSNIKVLTGDKVKQIRVDNYRLMSCCDAMISDYSGAAYEFIQLDRPLAYVLSDVNDYKLGFVVDDIEPLIAGKEIYNFKDLQDFINDVVLEKDEYKEKREKLRNIFYKYHDTNNCKRIVEFMGL